MTLIIMAAGMGSRYGGLKQLDPLGPGGEFIIDYSIYDAIACGFDHVVFVIKEENLELFRETVGKRIENRVKVDYAFQKLEDIPEGCTVPVGREKPYGTGHAVYCCRGVVRDSFAVINSDDFYGRDAFRCLAEFLSGEEGKRSGNDSWETADRKGSGQTDSNQTDDSQTGIGQSCSSLTARPHHYCMAGYRLKNTLTENGTVSRGICAADAENNLTTVVEHKKLERLADGRVINHNDDGTDTEVDENTPVSMNCWGFTPEFFDTLEQGLKSFMQEDMTANPLKAEYYIPTAVQAEIRRQTAAVRVLKTDSKWFGVTYREDRPGVVAAIKRLIEDGIYPEKLWK